MLLADAAALVVTVAAVVVVVLAVAFAAPDLFAVEAADVELLLAVAVADLLAEVVDAEVLKP